MKKTARGKVFHMVKQILRTFRKVIGLCTILVLVTGVSFAEERHNGCVDNYDSQKDYFPNKLQVEFAQNFEVTYHKNYKLVKVTNPWKNSKKSFEYVLVQCGTPTPKGYQESQIIQIPAKTMVVLSTTYLPFVDQLGLQDSLIGVSEFKSVNTTSIRKHIETGKVVEVGRNIDLNMESVVALNPDLIMMYGSGNPYKDVYAPLMDLGIRVGLFAEYMETTPLGRAEWVKYMSFFFNKESRAEEVFGPIVEEYLSMRRLTQNVSYKPTVFMGYDNKGTWYMASGQTYMSEFLKDAGADYLWGGMESRGSLPLDFETVYNKAADAEFWINISLWHSKGEGLALDNRYGNFSAFRTSKMFNNNASLNEHGGNDYWERGVANPQIVLADLIKIFHPELLPEYEMTFYQRLK